MAVKKVALLTAGGFAPCLSTAISGLIQRYTEVAPEVEIIAYKHGYEGLLKGDFLEVTDTVRKNAEILKRFGGSPIGNSRVKLTNAADLVKRGLVAEGETRSRLPPIDWLPTGLTFCTPSVVTTPIPPPPIWPPIWLRITTASPSLACRRPSITTSCRFVSR
ncbi:pyrophosphate-fructose 6-phosphate 1-phosphotransferase [Cutibacterium acnes JCM 18920]|nr:pyrophosphate-fructose 6-phosphate 1-phosphotransferase [Cutibacterium acnes JCM 18920]